MHKRRYPRYSVISSKLIIMTVLTLSIFLLAFFTKDFDFSFSKSEISIIDLSAFRISPQALTDLYSLAKQKNVNFYESLSLFLFENNFIPYKTEKATKEFIESTLFKSYGEIQSKYNKKQVKQVADIFEPIFTEMKYFPIPEGYSAGIDGIYSYGDTWGSQRTYGGERIHQGCDIMDRDNIIGRIPIVSMTDGTIENIGWNELGGWRVGIRSQLGTYYYYAHLDSFAPGLFLGQDIKAGSLIGFMGDTGYSKEPGTRGKFAVHLHIGISVNTKLIKKELWLNPYPLLRVIESSKISL